MRKKAVDRHDNKVLMTRIIRRRIYVMFVSLRKVCVLARKCRDDVIKSTWTKVDEDKSGEQIYGTNVLTKCTN